MDLDIRTSVNEVIVGMITGNFEETFERFYEHDVDTNAEGFAQRGEIDISREQTSAFRYVKATSVLVDGHKAAIEWELECTRMDGTFFTWKQVACQTWNNGKIVREILYHKSSRPHLLSNHDLSSAFRFHQRNLQGRNLEVPCSSRRSFMLIL